MTREERIAEVVRIVESTYAWPLDPKTETSHIAANNVAQEVVDLIDEEGRFVVVEFLTESLGEDHVNVHGPFTAAAAGDAAKRWGRATRAIKVVKLNA